MIRFRCFNLLLCVAILSVASIGPAETLEVCASGCPYATIQAAIIRSVANDTVLVHDGTYLETLDTYGRAITIRSENGPASTVIDANGLGRVVNIWRGEDDRTVIEGFTITGGDSTPYYGGGIRVNVSTPIIRECLITGNTAPKGGGVYVNSSAPVFRDCTINSNTATESNQAGGVYLYAAGADATFIDCSISNNTGDGVYADWQPAPVFVGCTISANSGPGVLTFESDIHLDDCTISNHMNDRGVIFSRGAPVISNSRIINNRNVEDGGGIWLNASAVIRDSIISGNLAQYGAGIDIHGSPPLIQRCLITGNGNTSTIEGGGISISNAEARIESCTISGNWALTGAGILIDDHPAGPVAPTIVNSTITGNYAQASNHGGAGLYLVGEEGVTVVKNSILWGNYARGGSGNSHEIEIDNGASIDVRYSVVAGGWSGTGNLNQDPAFVDPRPADDAPTSAGDYHLLGGSDCINAGTATNAAQTDIDKGNRPWAGGYDIGSDERGSNGHVFVDGFESGDTSAW